MTNSIKPGCQETFKYSSALVTKNIRNLEKNFNNTFCTRKQFATQVKGETADKTLPATG